MQTLYILTTVLHTNFLWLGELCQFWKWRTLTVSVPDFGSCHYRTYASATCYVLIMQHFRVVYRGISQDPVELSQYQVNTNDKWDLPCPRKYSGYTINTT